MSRPSVEEVVRSRNRLNYATRAIKRKDESLLEYYCYMMTEKELACLVTAAENADEKFKKKAKRIVLKYLKAFRGE